MVISLMSASEVTTIGKRTKSQTQNHPHQASWCLMISFQPTPVNWKLNQQSNRNLIHARVNFDLRLRRRSFQISRRGKAQLIFSFGWQLHAYEMVGSFVTLFHWMLNSVLLQKNEIILAVRDQILSFVSKLDEVESFVGHPAFRTLHTHEMVEYFMKLFEKKTEKEKKGSSGVTH